MAPSLFSRHEPVCAVRKARARRAWSSRHVERRPKFPQELTDGSFRQAIMSANLNPDPPCSTYLFSSSFPR
jgi:hypothetical protein